jgi:hypothetical protein
MKAVDLSPQEFEIEMTREECRILANCLTATCNEIDDFEFQLRTSYEKDAVLKVRDELLALLK